MRTQKKHNHATILPFLMDNGYETKHMPPHHHYIYSKPKEENPPMVGRIDTFDGRSRIAVNYKSHPVLSYGGDGKKEKLELITEKMVLITLAKKKGIEVYEENKEEISQLI